MATSTERSPIGRRRVVGHVFTVLTLAWLPLFVLTTGCEQVTSSQIDDSLLSATLPDDAIALSLAVERLQGDAQPATEEQEAASPSTTEPTRLSVEGMVHAGDHDPFQPGTAAFLLSDLPDPGHGDGSLEHMENCPFCRRRAEKATKAMVEFRDDLGKLIKTSADELLGLQKGDHVVVTGECTYNEELNLMTIQAASVHVR